MFLRAETVLVFAWGSYLYESGTVIGKTVPLLQNPFADWVGKPQQFAKTAARIPAIGQASKQMVF